MYASFNIFLFYYYVHLNVLSEAVDSLLNSALKNKNDGQEISKFILKSILLEQGKIVSHSVRLILICM